MRWNTGLYELTTLELVGQFRARAVTRIEAIATAAGRIIACQPGNNVSVTTADSPAPVSALSASPLARVPTTHKDTLCTRGMRTTYTSKTLGDFIPCYDAIAVECLTAAGAMSMDKLSLDEFAIGSTCETSYYGPTKNPWGLTHSPDGSSGGVIATVAVGKVWYIIGSDIGGSIRQPAAHCSVIGTRPTYDPVSRCGLVAYASSLGQIGPITRFAVDCAATLEFIRGRGPRDANSLELPAGGLLCALTNDVWDRRTGLPVECFGGALEPEVATAVRAVAGVL